VGKEKTHSGMNGRRKKNKVGTIRIWETMTFSNGLKIKIIKLIHLQSGVGGK